MRLHQIKYILIPARNWVVNTWRRWLSAVLPYRPIEGGQELLDAEYANGMWDYLRGTTELSRFSIVMGYCHYFRPEGKILEIGCGEGILQERLCPTRYSRYIGLDISTEAIQRASQKQDEKTFFVREDAAVYVPDTRFDLIIFNECLEYFDAPLSILRRYETFLETDGLYIVSMFVGTDTVRTKRIWKNLEAIYRLEAETHVSTKKGYSWLIKVLIPTRSKIETLNS